MTGWDCHAHVFGPYDRFALALERSYTPPEAPLVQYLALLNRLGLSHGVLVQPSAYGRDHALLFNALAAQPALRGVMVASAASALAGVRRKGVRGVRYSHRSGAGANFAGSASFDDLWAMREALVREGLHAELWTDCIALPDLASRIEQLPTAPVIDHMGGFDVQAGVDEPGFRTLLSLLERGKVWVKLCAYRNVPDLEQAQPFHAQLLQANPKRLLWGSDWPHLRIAPVPDAALLLQRFKDWTGNAAAIAQILVDNPAALYE